MARMRLSSSSLLWERIQRVSTATHAEIETIHAMGCACREEREEGRRRWRRAGERDIRRERTGPTLRREPECECQSQPCLVRTSSVASGWRGGSSF